MNLHPNSRYPVGFENHFTPVHIYGIANSEGMKNRNEWDEQTVLGQISSRTDTNSIIRILITSKTNDPTVFRIQILFSWDRVVGIPHRKPGIYPGHKTARVWIRVDQGKRQGHGGITWTQRISVTEAIYVQYRIWIIPLIRNDHRPFWYKIAAIMIVFNDFVWPA